MDRKRRHNLTNKKIPTSSIYDRVITNKPKQPQVLQLVLFLVSSERVMPTDQTPSGSTTGSWNRNCKTSETRRLKRRTRLTLAEFYAPTPDICAPDLFDTGTRITLLLCDFFAILVQYCVPDFFVGRQTTQSKLEVLSLRNSQAVNLCNLKKSANFPQRSKHLCFTFVSTTRGKADTFITDS